ncbi:MAG: hypothetical protein DRI97_01585 [Bacteroidetes bacterium]|nr:MAG: hypothetical protein DRI83_00905 [Bacteroidota bacterium]RLD59177.1 MAG: hypothetical protein DRI97_01585 [Bacteroidota bacterium]RLD80159.1 MAG: hypothetical protein DRJ15_07720 [Bacteroidota bacterium]
MYNLSQNLSLLFLSSNEKIYAKSSVQVKIYSTENIPAPSASDIIVTDKGAVGKDIEIRLRVSGPISETTKTESLTIPVEIINTGQELDEQGVRDAVGSKVYNVKTVVYKDGDVKKEKTGQVNAGSNVEID